jgi:hypothetical protein
MQSIIALSLGAALTLAVSDADAQSRGSSGVDPRAPSGVHSSRDGDRGAGGVTSSRDGDRGVGRVQGSRDDDDRYSRSGDRMNRDGYNGRHSVPRGFMPHRGMCRVWLEGVPAGRQPRVTSCETALRNRPVNGRVLFGSDGITRSGHDRYGRSQFTVYRVMLNNRRCEVREQFDRYGRAHYERRCEQSRRSSRDDWWEHDTHRRDDRIRFGDWLRV